MASKIKNNIPNKYVSIEHLGTVRGDIEITTDIETDDCSGAMENYTFIDNVGQIILTVELDSNEELSA